MASLTAALGLTFAFAASAAPTPARASTWLRYERGYSVQGSWLCYAWSSGTYHCTQHWYRASNDRLISTNSGWVPNYGSDSVHTTSAPAERSYTMPRHFTSTAPVRRAPPAITSHTNGGSYNGGGSVQSMIRSVFGAYANQALNVAACESGYNPGAYNRSSGASGVFQFLRSTWMTTAYAGYSPFNAWANINAAHQVFARDGNSWREWSCGYRA